MVVVNNLYKKFGNNPVFHNLSLTIDGNRSCIVAPNGFGKSTLLCSISGTLSFDSGEITYDGMPVSSQIRNIAMASDAMSFPEFLLGRELLVVCKKIFKCDWPSQILNDFFLQEHLEKPIGALSSGNLKKLKIVHAIMRNPPLLLLDEPNTNLDESSLEILWNTIKEFNGQIIVASNEPDLYSKHGFTIKNLNQIDQ